MSELEQREFIQPGNIPVPTVDELHASLGTLQSKKDEIATLDGNVLDEIPGWIDSAEAHVRLRLATLMDELRSGNSPTHLIGQMRGQPYSTLVAEEVA